MKAAFQNTVPYLLCLASVVLAAPHQSMSIIRPERVRAKAPACSCPGKKSCEPAKAVAAPSLLDGSARLELW